MRTSLLGQQFQDSKPSLMQIGTRKMGRKTVEKTTAIVRNMPLLFSTITRMACENPMHLGVQMIRRMPIGVREKLSQSKLGEIAQASADPMVAATWNLLIDRPDIASTLLKSAPHLNEGWLRRSWGNELRLNLRLPLTPTASETQKVRQSWDDGDVLAAVQVLKAVKSPAFRERQFGLLRTIDPHWWLKLPDQKSPREKETFQEILAGKLRVLHFLTNSLPWTNSGYSLRSQGIIEAQNQADMHAMAVTRLAYPVLIGRPVCKKSDLVGRSCYRRILPFSMPGPVDKKLLRQAQELQKIVTEYHPHVLHTTTDYLNGLTVRAVAKAEGLPWVYEMRGELEKTWLSRHPNPVVAESSLRYRLMRQRETELALEADAVVALSKTQANSLVQRGVAAEKIWVVPNSVDEKLLEIERNSKLARKQLGLADGFWVGSVSALVPYEGFETLLRAVALLDEDVRCLLVGDGTARAELLGLAKSLGIADRVVFPGKVSPSQAQLWSQALDVMTIPRIDSPLTRIVTPVKGLTAMALGIPQIVSALPALEEISVSDGQGIAVNGGEPADWAEAIGRLKDNQNLLSEMSRCARVAASTKTWANTAQIYRSMYEKLAEPSNAREGKK